MNYRRLDIIEIEYNNKLVTAKIESLYKFTLNVILEDSERIPGGYGNYHSLNIKYESIKRVIKRKRGKSYKKKYDIKLIDENGNIIEND